MIRVNLLIAAAMIFGAAGTTLAQDIEFSHPKTATSEEAHARDIAGVTEMMKAAEEGDIDRINALFAAGADVNARSNGGQTALMKASAMMWTNERHRLNCVKTLIELGADINPKDVNGKTAIMFALTPAPPREMNGGIPMRLADPKHQILMDCVRALVNAGADLREKDRNGRTALDYTRIPNVQAYLRAAAAAASG